jgi:hypothetical protein
LKNQQPRQRSTTHGSAGPVAKTAWHESSSTLDSQPTRLTVTGHHSVTAAGAASGLSTQHTSHRPQRTGHMPQHTAHRPQHTTQRPQLTTGNNTCAKPQPPGTCAAAAAAATGFTTQQATNRCQAAGTRHVCCCVRTLDPPRCTSSSCAKGVTHTGPLRQQSSFIGLATTNMLECSQVQQRPGAAPCEAEAMHLPMPVHAALRADQSPVSYQTVMSCAPSHPKLRVTRIITRSCKSEQRHNTPTKRSHTHACTHARRSCCCHTAAERTGRTDTTSLLLHPTKPAVPSEQQLGCLMGSNSGWVHGVRMCIKNSGVCQQGVPQTGHHPPTTMYAKLQIVQTHGATSTCTQQFPSAQLSTGQGTNTGT